ncbi:MAG: hypothetical protein DRP85_07400 [Candidatus Makaraimicrobium thalassicum]|nr:MAG: hypothetical protein DRP85_07400 [Candidatus Omnitrophota bacterium]
MKEKTTVAIGSIVLSSSAYISTTIMFIVSILFARYLEKDVFGLYLFVISLSAIIYLFTNFGVDGLSFYFISRNKDKRSDVAKSIILLSTKIKLILTTLILIILTAIGFYDYRYWYVAIFLVAFVPNKYTRGLLEALQHFRLAGQLQIIESIVKLILIYAILTYITTTQLSIILFAIIIPMLISSILATRAILGTLPKTAPVNLRSLKAEAYHYGKWFALGSILTPIMGNIVQVTLGLLNEYTTLAVFGIGKTLSNLVIILGTSFKSAMLPSFLKKSEIHDISSALTRSIRYPLIISIFLAFLIHSISYPFITFFYTIKYAESAIIFEILSYGILFNIVFIGLPPATTAAGRPDIHIKISIINVIILVSSAIILIPLYGAFGAAIAITSGLIVGTTAYALVTHKYLKYSFPWKTLSKCIIASSLAILPSQIIEVSQIYKIILNIGVGSMLYILILYIIKEIQPEDTELMQECIKRIRRYRLWDKIMLSSYPE